MGLVAGEGVGVRRGASFLLCFVCFAGGAPVVLAQEPLATDKPSAVALLREEARLLAPRVHSPLGKALLAAVPALPAVAAVRVVHYNRTSREALSPEAASKRTAAELEGFERRELDEHFYYYTKYGTPLAAVRALDLAGQAGLASVDGAKVLDFGFGSIGQLRLLASLGADVTGVEVDQLLQQLYAAPGDTGAIPRASAAGAGRVGSLRLLFGSFPGDAKLVAAAGTGYALFISKNTLKRGYIHPERDVEPRLLVHLGVDDEAYVHAVHSLLAPGGLMLIYNLSPAPSKPDEPYKPWSDGRTPFARELFEAQGFEIIAFDQDDTPEARAWGATLGWGEQMDLDSDLFGTYTLVRKR